MLFKFQTFTLKPEVCEMGRNFWLQNGLNLLRIVEFFVSRPKTTHYLSQLAPRTILKIGSQFSENAIFEKFVKILFPQ